MLLARGNVTMDEARQLVEVERNGLVIAMRDPLTPFGKFYSELLKPVRDLPTLDRLIVEKGSIEAVLQSVGKSRVAVNRIAFIARRAGPAAITVDIVLTVVIVDLAPPAERGKVLAQQVGGVAESLAGARYGGFAGAWAGTAAFTLAGSPTLMIPVVGEITEAGAAVAGGVIGFFFGGASGWKLGQTGGGLVWQLPPISWKSVQDTPSN